MEHFAVASVNEPAPASDAELTFLCDYMSVGQQYSQYFASAEGRSRIASGGRSQTKQIGETLHNAAPSQVLPAMLVFQQMFCMEDTVGKEELMHVLCSPVLADALWARVGGCCQYLYQQQQQREQAHEVASSSSSTCGPSRGREGRGRSKKGGSSRAGMGWAELDVPPDHRLLPVPGGQVAVMAQENYLTRVREQEASLVGEDELGRSMHLM